MMKFVIAAVLAIFLALPARAQAVHTLLVFHHNSPSQVDVMDADPQTLPQTDTWFVFNPINGDMIAQDYSFNSSGYFLKPVATPAPVVKRDVLGFIAAVRVDPMVDSTLRMELAGLLGLVNGDYQNPAGMAQDWNDAKTVFGSSWFTPSVQNMIYGYAKTYGIPLDAGIP